MTLTEWAKAHGVHPQTACRWFREGTLPVLVERVGLRMIVVNVGSNSTPASLGGLGLYARVSSHDQRSDVDRQIARLSSWAAGTGDRVVRVEAEVGSGMKRKALEAAVADG